MKGFMEYFGWERHSTSERIFQGTLNFVIMAHIHSLFSQYFVIYVIAYLGLVLLLVWTWRSQVFIVAG
jgi:hypothetical protein